MVILLFFNLLASSGLPQLAWEKKAMLLLLLASSVEPHLLHIF